MTRNTISFALNGRWTEESDLEPTTPLLNYLRLDKRLVGTKEGCAEGDCGACTVLIGRAENGKMQYNSGNACIILMPMIDGCDVVTVEHLKNTDGALHPVQQAMVDYHGSQCGFCTPGFVMSLTGAVMNEPWFDEEVIERNVQGNLCRCTGYASIIHAGLAAKAATKHSDLADRLEASSKMGVDRRANDGASIVSASGVKTKVP